MTGYQMHEHHMIQAHHMNMDRDLRGSALRKALREARGEERQADQALAQSASTSSHRRHGWLQQVTTWVANILPS